jgi:hypothetical protein
LAKVFDWNSAPKRSVANHPNYNIVGRILNDPTFGRVLSQLDPRQLQFGAKVVF